MTATKRIPFVLILTGIILYATTSFAEAICLSRNGVTECIIVQASDATEPEKYAAKELVDYLYQITGAEFMVRSDLDCMAASRIVVGPGSLSRNTLGKDLVDNLGKEEFIIKTVGNDLYLVGGRPRGTLYAVYHLLDNILGVRWWAPGATYVPSKPNLTIDSIDLRLEPCFESRDPFLTTAWNKEWAVRNRTNGTAKPDAAHGGYVSYGSYFCHTFNALIPPDKYFDSHPEWFSMIDGKRVKEESQLCLTNPEVKKFMTEQVLAALKADPDMQIISVTQNDNLEGYCRCPDCRKVDEEEDSHSGTMIRFVNEIAEAVEKEYPNVYVDTFAYQYTRRPPKHVKPRDNVIVRLCSIECSFSFPLDHPQNKDFADDIQGWARIAKNIYIWDYITNFTNYFQPHPNLRSLGPNLRFFAENNVKGVFEQGSYGTPGGEFEELRAWVLSRLLWNPNQDDQALIREFVEGYYGSAAPFIQAYIDTIHNTLDGTDYYMGCFDSGPSPFITSEIMYRAERFFTLAEASVAGQPEILSRVKKAHMPVECMWLVYYNLWVKDDKTAYPVLRPFEEIASDFTAQVKAGGITQLSERSSMSDFLVFLEEVSSDPTVKASAISFYRNSVPSKAFDGNPETCWRAGPNNLEPQWLQKDFGREMIIKKIHTEFIDYYTHVTYKIEGSIDGETWYTLVPEKTARKYIVDDAVKSQRPARFIRTTIISSYTGEARRSAVITDQVIY